VLGVASVDNYPTDHGEEESACGEEAKTSFAGCTPKIPLVLQPLGRAAQEVGDAES